MKTAILLFSKTASLRYWTGSARCLVAFSTTLTPSVVTVKYCCHSIGFKSQLCIYTDEENVIRPLWVSWKSAFFVESNRRLQQHTCPLHTHSYVWFHKWIVYLWKWSVVHELITESVKCSWHVNASDFISKLRQNNGKRRKALGELAVFWKL